MSESPPSSIKRLYALDSLRGIAAFIVIISHIQLIWPNDDLPFWYNLGPLRLIYSGYASVLVFFVLSGYVLSLPFIKNTQPPYWAYFIRRVCRIYIPFAAAILFAAFLYTHNTHAPYSEGSEWFHEEWAREPLTWSVIFKHIAMTGRFKDMWLDRVMWSLVHELRISMIFPVLFVICRQPRIAAIGAIILYIVAVLLSLYTGNDWSLIEPRNFTSSYLFTLRFTPFFMLGILLAYNNHAIQNWLDQRSVALQWSLFMLALIVVSMPTEINNKRILSMLSMQNNPILIKYFAECMIGLAAGMLVVLSRRANQSLSKYNILNWKAVHWLGKVSYSLYLVHLPIVFFTFRLLLGRMNFFAIAALAITASLAAAGIFNELIEQPAMRLGRLLTAKKS